MPRNRRINRLTPIIAILLLIGIAVVALLAIAELPTYGSADNPVHNYVSGHYIEQALEDTGALNMVASIIIDYRAYDTLIETTVLFTSIIAVFIVLKKGTDH